MDKIFFQSLFPEGIYLVPEKPQNKQPEEESTVLVEEINYLGENNQRILILLNEKSEAMINEMDKEFLSKILGAVKLTFNDIALVNISSYHWDLSSEWLEAKLVFQKVIGFGVEMDKIFKTDKITKYKISLHNGIELLVADSLSDIQNDKTLKVKLWEELKRLFS